MSFASRNNDKDVVFCPYFALLPVIFDKTIPSLPFLLLTQRYENA
jgi:hypothetical protein